VGASKVDGCLEAMVARARAPGHGGRP
jgi:hypothetical protein